jgi:hypothetical protein
MTAGVYAKETEVSPEKSRGEIERTLGRYGATDFGYAVTGDRAQIAFRIGTNTVRMRLAFPPVEDFARTPTGRARDRTAAASEREKAIRQRWRALALVVKAKLEAIEAGIATFEEEWFAYLVLPDGSTVFEQASEHYRTAIASGRSVPMLEAS